MNKITNPIHKLMRNGEGFTPAYIERRLSQLRDPNHPYAQNMEFFSIYLDRWPITIYSTEKEYLDAKERSKAKKEAL